MLCQQKEKNDEKIQYLFYYRDPAAFFFVL